MPDFSSKAQRLINDKQILLDLDFSVKDIEKQLYDKINAYYVNLAQKTANKTFKEKAPIIAMAVNKFEKDIDKLDKKIKQAIVKGVEGHVRTMMKKAWRCSDKAKYYKNL